MMIDLSHIGLPITIQCDRCHKKYQIMVKEEYELCPVCVNSQWPVMQIPPFRKG